jgi:acetyl-CoA C-acetyltransferase
LKSTAKRGRLASPKPFPAITSEENALTEAVIVSVARTPIGKAYRGAFNDTEAPVLGGHAIRAVVARAGIAPAEVEDVLIGCAAQQGTQGYNLARLCAYTGGLPETVPGMTFDRQCSSGLMTIAAAAKTILAGEQSIIIAGGVESISLTQNAHKNSYRAVSEAVVAAEPTAYIPMIETAELVAERYGISRDSQDDYALQSQQRTAAAQAAGRFDDEIVPLSAEAALRQARPADRKAIGNAGERRGSARRHYARKSGRAQTGLEKRQMGCAGPPHHRRQCFAAFRWCRGGVVDE